MTMGLFFNNCAADKIILGEQSQTVLQDSKGFQMGDLVNLWIGKGSSRHMLGEARVRDISTVEIHTTYMVLDGQTLPNAIYSRDQLEPTDTEFAEACGFDGYMEMSDAIEKMYGLPTGINGAPFVGIVIKWDLVQ